MTIGTSLETPVFNPVTVTQELIRRPSVTPDREGGLDVVQRHLAAMKLTTSTPV